MSTRPILVALFLLALPSAPRAEVFEPATGRRFAETQTVGGASYQLVGIGLRKKFIVKVYAMGLYVEVGPAKQAFARGAGDPKKFVAGGAFGKLGVLHFVRDVGADKIREAYKDGLAEWMAASPEQARLGESFIALFDHDMAKNEELQLQTGADGAIQVTLGGVHKNTGLRDRRLAEAVWRIWLGKGSIAEQMGEDLVALLDGLK